MSEPEAKRHRILIAEDVKPIALLAQTVLVNRNFEVEIAPDGEECLSKARLWRPDLILLDLMMPKIHGMEVLRQLKADAATREIGVLMCTAKRYKPDHDQAMALGAFDVLFKPFGKEELLSAVNRFFTGGQLAAPALTAAPGENYLPTIPADRCYCRFWGTRGSIPVSSPRFARHGGNTSCIEVGCGDDMVIVDAGSGIRELGQSLLKKGPRRLHILITHTHWDHIQGFPFFAPAYIPGYELIFYSATGFKKDLNQVFRGQLDSDYFPVQFDDMRAKIEFRTLESKLEINGFEISWEYTHHPAATVGFKFKRDGRTLGYVSDNEFLYGYLGRPHGLKLDSETVAPHRPLVDFLTDVNVFIGEAQYLNSEYPAKIGWGHSSLSNGCALAHLARVGKWVVTHHDPIHDDDLLDKKLNLTREILDSLSCDIEVRHAHDGWIQHW
jgi:CheY-like chemotaxis protein/ribonuclease BN (tRNA processing enzyme)